MPELDPGTIIRVLNKHRVRYVVIGGVAAEIHDLPVPATVDIDITPARDRGNLECLAGAFEELEAGLYTAEAAGTWFPRTPVERQEVMVITVAQWEALKQASGRAKDLEHLDRFYASRSEE
ncbi:MAG: hypothetical protein ACOYL9_10035 [Ilumatobacteraceae bacterium]